MSIIHEALRKAQERSQKGILARPYSKEKPPKPVAPKAPARNQPSNFPPEPEPSTGELNATPELEKIRSAEQPRQSTATWLFLMGLGLVLILGSVEYAVLRLQKDPGLGNTAGGSEVSPVPAFAPKAPVADPLPMSPHPAPAVDSKELAKAEQSLERIQELQLSLIKDTALPAPAPAAPVFPPCKVRGIADINGAQMAILNDEVVFEGDVVDGIRVESIRSQAVTLEFEGLRRVVRIR
ncbi:MAG: hypothetical protein JW937_10120 [Candidatus Omnitrophica bacterium]|nr:hypothetical protein [Candidatus Omnitrophota bacterium]